MEALKPCTSRSDPVPRLLTSSVNVNVSDEGEDEDRDEEEERKRVETSFPSGSHQLP